MSALFQSILKKINNILYRVKLAEKLFFTQNLNLMIKSGVSLSRALAILSEQTTNKKLKKILKEVYQNIEKGQTLSKSLEFYPEVFSSLFVNMIKAGEESGKLDEILTQAALQMKKDYELLSKIKGALIYPIIVISAMILIVGAMMLFAIPELTTIFTEAGVELPLPTQILIFTSNLLTNNIILILTVIVFLIIIFLKFKKTEKGKKILHKLILNLPIFSPIVLKVNLARFTRSLFSLLKTDIPIMNSFDITANLLSNIYYKKALNEAKQKLIKGETIAASLKEYHILFPPIINQIILIGEETGRLDEILEETAKFYEDDLENIFKNLPSLIEPLLLLFLGIVVGGIAVAIMMPIYSLSKTAG